MKHENDNEWLDPMLESQIHREPEQFDFEKWAENHPEEARLLRCGFEKSGRSTKTKPFEIWRFIMESKVTRYSAVAVVALAAALVLLGPFGTSKNGGVALADVQEKIAQVDTMILQGHKAFSCVDDPNITFDFDLVKYISKQYGYTEKGYVKDKLAYNITINLPEKETLILMPIQKKYLKFPCTDKQLELIKKISPQGVVEILTQADYEKLGFSEINGIKVEGFAFEDAGAIKEVLPKAIFNIKQGKGSIWVGVEELIPVRMEGDISIGKCLFTAFTNFNLHEVNVLQDYNVELDKEKFDTKIPEGYTELTLSDILPLIPLKVKAGITGLGLCFFIIPAGFIVRKRRRRKKAAAHPN